jgi:hypothetical protein
MKESNTDLFGIKGIQLFLYDADNVRQTRGAEAKGRLTFLLEVFIS